jgi:peptidyl-prolyl cis-trans isomerase B (cyclophilin B)
VPTSKQRREAARRHLERQLQQRQAQEAARKRRVLIATVAGTLVLALVVVLFVVFVTHDKSGSSAAASASASASPSASATASASAAAAKYPCTWTSSGTAARKVSKPSTTTPPKTGTVVISVGTTRGPMTFTLNRAQAPCTVASFESLVKQKFYDNTPCPRVESQTLFILQCGDPTGTGAGGPGYTVPDEYTGKEKYTAGTLAMANTGEANSGGSQFFIVYKDDPLPASYTIFGKVTSGLDVVTKVAAGGNDGSNSAGGGKPKLPINLTTLTVKSG